jgi:hypothetical protein
MTKLAWGTPGERYYETGIDRGVVFIDGVGYAWNGLSSVTEKSSGGELQEYYLDGVKYAQITTAEDFEATIEAYSSPREFAVCDGSYEIYNGLTATQQRRKTFGFSYRTRVGNDTSGTDLGYKLHVVYNALAAPNEKSHSTESNSVAPEKMTWDVTTVPNQLTGLRPTAHFVIDSRRADVPDLTALENLLYGTDVTTPSLPTAAALVAIFA